MVGQVVGNYRIVEQIGVGGMGTVYRGMDQMLQREVAVKMVRPSLAHQPGVIDRFKAEAVTLARLNHPNIATLYSFLQEGEDYFMVMEFVRGETLEDLLLRTRAMSPAKAIPIISRALDGLQHAHEQGVVHRDIKPANIMLTPAGQVKLMDFGIARALGSDRMTRTGRLVGTIEYMSPEQVQGQEGDGRSDIYALGIVLYKMLTGNVPFAHDSDYGLMRAQVEATPPSLRTFVADLPEPLEAVTLTSLEKAPAHRYQSAAEFRAALLAHMPTRLHEQAPPPMTRIADLEATVPMPPASSSGAHVAAGSGAYSASSGSYGAASGAGGYSAADAALPSAESKVVPMWEPWLAKAKALPWPYYAAAGVVLLGLMIGIWLATADGPAPEQALADTEDTRDVVPTDPQPVLQQGGGTSSGQDAASNPQMIRISDLMTRANQLFAAGSLTTPPGENAWAYCRQVLAIAPQHAEALQMQQQIARRITELADAETRRGNLTRAEELYRQSLSVLSPNAEVTGKLRDLERRRTQVAARQRTERPAPSSTRQQTPPPVAKPEDSPPVVEETLQEPEETAIEKPAPARRQVRLKSGTRFAVALTQPLSSAQAHRKGGPVSFRVTQAVRVDGAVVIRAGARGFGSVRDARAGEGRTKGLLEFVVETVEAVDGTQVALKSATFKQVADRGKDITYGAGQAFEVRTARSMNIGVQ